MRLLSQVYYYPNLRGHATLGDIADEHIPPRKEDGWRIASVSETEVLWFHPDHITRIDGEDYLAEIKSTLRDSSAHIRRRYSHTLERWEVDCPKLRVRLWSHDQFDSKGKDRPF